MEAQLWCISSTQYAESCAKAMFVAMMISDPDMAHDDVADLAAKECNDINDACRGNRPAGVAMTLADTRNMYGSILRRALEILESDVDSDA